MGVRERLQQRRFQSVAQEALLSLIVAAEQIEQRTAEVLERHGLTTDQFNVLRILRGVHPGGHPRGEVARRMIHRAPDVTRMLDRLERQGLIARCRDSDDRRMSVATITREGLALLDRLDPELQVLQAEITAPLGEAELRQLARLCDALIP
jgi:DNA-binding MarR family transcriptional regulator